MLGINLAIAAHCSMEFHVWNLTQSFPQLQKLIFFLPPHPYKHFVYVSLAELCKNLTHVYPRVESLYQSSLPLIIFQGFYDLHLHIPTNTRHNSDFQYLSINKQPFVILIFVSLILLNFNTTLDLCVDFFPRKSLLSINS